ncbi:PadR family transcriptional regulator [Halocatena halophila]|uniref:PadR family transcriptional regulator n=1 Tax=Halocatena halophila TaxID=2814576 RepID=UPI002ED4B971
MGEHTAFIELNAPKRDLLTLLSHGDPVKEVEIGADLKQEIDGVVSYARIYDQLQSLEERGLVTERATERWKLYQITPRGQSVLREYHSWFRNILDENSLTNDEYSVTHIGGGACRAIPPESSDDD